MEVGRYFLGKSHFPASSHFFSNLLSTWATSMTPWFLRERFIHATAGRSSLNGLKKKGLFFGLHIGCLLFNFNWIKPCDLWESRKKGHFRSGLSPWPPAPSPSSSLHVYLSEVKEATVLENFLMIRGVLLRTCWNWEVHQLYWAIAKLMQLQH